MSVYTQLSQNQLSSILKHYGISSFEHVEAIHDGIENSNFLIQTNSQAYVLTIFENLTPETLKPILSFMAYAAGAGFAIPEPKALQDNNFFYFAEDLQKPLVLCPKLAGKHPEPADMQSALIRQVGETFARIHLCSTNNSAVLNEFSFDDLSFFYQHNTQGLELSEEKKQLIQNCISQFRVLNTNAHKLPKGLCHCDFFPDNSLIENGQLSALLDWYDARYTCFLLDIAVLAISWCVVEGKLNQQLLDALLEGYKNIRPLETIEQSLLDSFIALAAFNFWLSRENYHAEMARRQQNPSSKKPKEEFFQLLKNLTP